MRIILKLELEGLVEVGSIRRIHFVSEVTVVPKGRQSLRFETTLFEYKGQNNAI